MSDYEPPTFNTVEDFDRWLWSAIPAGMSRSQADEILGNVVEQITGRRPEIGTAYHLVVEPARRVLAEREPKPGNP